MEKTGLYTNSQRMKLKGQIVLASEIIAPYWPMGTFVHHNPLHNLEYLPFSKAVSMGRDLLGGNGFMPIRFYRESFLAGRIRPEHVDLALAPLARDPDTVAIGDLKLTRLDVLRAHLLHGFTSPPDEVFGHLLDLRPDRGTVEHLARHLARPENTPPTPDTLGGPPKEALFQGWPTTLSAWCDRTIKTRITEMTNFEMVKWCEAFLDEDHATWTMPGREKGFFRAWKFLARQEWSPSGIPDSRKKIAGLPDTPEDALLEHLEWLDIPSDLQLEYLSLHFSALPGWAGFIKWRADRDDYPFQESYPIDLLQYLAVRLWYERELVRMECRNHLGIDGTFESIRTHNKTLQDAVVLPLPNTLPMRRKEAWRLLELANMFRIKPEILSETPPNALHAIIGWIDGFPESGHGPVWLEAYEAGYRDHLVGKLKNALSHSRKPDEDATRVRPQGQAVFCIDVRSEPFRRHFERVGDYETFGFAGFFSVFVKYREMGSHHETDQFPVIMKARNVVQEVSRPYHGELLSRLRTGNKLLNAGHELLHDLKENVVTPYVAVESFGWFYGLPLIGKTIFPAAYRKWITLLRHLFVPRVSTALTVDKLSREEVAEMLAAEQRSIIRQTLQDAFGDRNLNLSLERLEFLRKRALDEIRPDQEYTGPRSVALTLKEEELFIGELRRRHRITRGWAFARMERITQIGFTLEEQIFTVETALRMMGLTRNFARLVLFCGHGSRSENNPFESALDCGACGGNSGKPNARILATMANKANVREQLAMNGISIPADTFFIAGEHNTTTDEVRLFDLEDLPHTHNKDLLRLTADLQKTGSRNSRERYARFPEVREPLNRTRAAREVQKRSADWSQNRPEWGLSGNAAFLIGRRDLIRRIDLEGRAFLHSYDYREDTTGRLLEIIMTGPQVVGEWISMEHYFSTVDNEVYGGGSKIYHNVVGRFGIMSGPQGDLRTGLAQQTVMNGRVPYHEPMRLLTVIESPPDRISGIIAQHSVLEHFYDNGWVRLMALNPDDRSFHSYVPHHGWVPFVQEDVHKPLS
ncbi:MAG: DUF2309 domain-containing protein [Leptospirales bacterium]